MKASSAYRKNPNISQKDEIINLLRMNESLTQGELAILMYGSNKFMPNIYESLKSLTNNGTIFRTGHRPSYYSLNKNVDVKVIKRDDLQKPNKVKSQSFVPRPSVEEVEYWLEQRNKLEDYTAQEEALDQLFFGNFKANDNLNNILIKCSVLNDFYSTNIFKVYHVADHILKLNIDERLKNGDPTLVDDISRVVLNEKEKHLYSFASKYCSHHNPFEYPIFDSYVEKVLKHFRKIDNFFKFNNEDLKIYNKFKEILLQFRSYYNLDCYNLKELDKYLWQLGKRYFPKKYKNKKSDI